MSQEIPPPGVSRAGYRRVPVYILAGGRSSRFGSDKARALLGGQALLQRVGDELAPFASQVTVIAATDGAYADLGFRTLGDAVPGRGPLTGLSRALDDLEATPYAGDWLLLVPCDTIDTRPEWIAALLEATANPRPAAVAFRGSRWEPLPALYHRSLAPLAHHLRDSGLGLGDLLRRCEARGLALPPGFEQRTRLDTRQALHERATREASPQFR